MTVVAKLVNSEFEIIDIAKVDTGSFTGQYILRIHDDKHISNTIAMHLLDKQTVRFLLEELGKL